MPGLYMARNVPGAEADDPTDTVFSAAIFPGIGRRRCQSKMAEYRVSTWSIDVMRCPLGTSNLPGYHSSSAPSITLTIGSSCLPYMYLSKQPRSV